VVFSSPFRARSSSLRIAQGFALAFALIGAICFSGLSEAKVSAGGLGRVEWVQLPPEAQHTHRLILSGGPFPYSKDGSVFGNRERLLPLKPRGFYREYTVPTPAAVDRGARRIVCGGSQPRAPEACFYSGNHYASFDLIVR
jgi:ribonuclease T1